GHRDRPATVGIEVDVASVAVRRRCDRLVGAPETENGRVGAGAHDRVRANGVVVLLVHPPLGGDGRRIEELAKGPPGIALLRPGAQLPGVPLPQPGNLRTLPPFTGVGRALVHQRLAGNIHYDPTVLADHVAARVRYVANGGSVQIPAGEDRPDLLLVALAGDHEHALLRLGEQDLVRGHPGLANGHPGDLD